jgi:hypothetical protein
MPNEGIPAPPLSEETFLAWLAAQGFSVELSDLPRMYECYAHLARMTERNRVQGFVYLARGVHDSYE